MTKTKGRSSPTPRKSKFSALEFTAEDERVDKDSRITLCKFKKRKSPQEHSPINKYTSLKSFARAVKNILNEFVDELVDTRSSGGPMDVGIIKSHTVASSGSSGCKPSVHNRTEYHGSEFSSLATTTSSARLSGIVTDAKHLHSRPSLIPADASLPDEHVLKYSSNVHDTNEPVVVDSNDDPVIELRLPKSPSIIQLKGLPDEHVLKYSSNVHDTNEPVAVDSDDDPVIELRSSKSPSIVQLQGLPDEHVLMYSSNVHDSNEPVVDLDDDPVIELRLPKSPSIVQLQGWFSSYNHSCLPDEHVLKYSSNVHDTNEPVVDSDDDPVIELRSTKSPSIVQLQGLPDERVLKYSSNVHDTEALVVVIPDHIIYRKLWSTSSCLSFSPKCIKLEGLPNSETMPSTFKWKVSAVVDIQSVWIDSIKTADVTIRLIAKTRRSRVVRILRFAVSDPDWSDKQEAIQSLDFRYKERWRTAG
nr:probable ubiquitin-like-specific protease 2A isoform X1 [Ipomoea trifida]